MKGTSKDDFFREAKYDRQMFGIINRHYTVHLTWSVLITIMCNIWMKMVTASPENVQTIPRNQARKKKAKINLFHENTNIKT
jgi:hypothetical protein